METKIALIHERVVEVAKVLPQILTPEKAKYVTETRLKLELGVSEELMAQIRRAQDLVSQSKNKSVNLEETMEEVLDLFLEKKDPVKKAERALKNIGTDSYDMKSDNIKSDAPASVHGQTHRQPLTASIKHFVQLRDGGQCTKQIHGERCPQRRWLDIHHIIPVSKGGTNEVSNLSTLCGNHHRQMHL